MSKLAHLYSLVLLGLCLSTAVAQRTWRVHCAGGPNVDFFDLPQAVAAAAPGDTILVYRVHGLDCERGHAYTAPTIDKPIDIVGFFVGRGTSGKAILKDTVRVRNIASGQRVTLTNLILVSGSVPTPYVPMAPSGLIIADCAGKVVMEDLYIEANGYSNHTVRVERSSDVIWRGTWIFPGSPIEVTDSTVTFTNCYVTWSSPAHYPYVAWPTTGPALWIRNGHVTSIASLFRGAWTYQPPFGSLQPGREGALLESGSLTLGPWTFLRGGGASGTTTTAPSFVMPNPAVAQVIVDPRAAPLTHWGQPPPMTTADVHATYHDYVQAGQPYRVSVAGPPNGFAFLAVGIAAMQPTALPQGLLAMEPASVSVMGLAPLDSSGWHQWNPTCPANVPVGYLFAFQGATLSPSGAVGLTLPSVFTVAWPPGVSP